MNAVGTIKAALDIAARAQQTFGAHRAIRNSSQGFTFEMNGEKVEQEPFPLLSRWAGKPGEHQQRGGYHARPANKRKTEMSDTIETQNDDLFATVSFGGGGRKKRGGRSGGRKNGGSKGGSVRRKPVGANTCTMFDTNGDGITDHVKIMPPITSMGSNGVGITTTCIVKSNPATGAVDAQCNSYPAYAL